jgi:hypothetical protein
MHEVQTIPISFSLCMSSDLASGMAVINFCVSILPRLRNATNQRRNNGKAQQEIVLGFKLMKKWIQINRLIQQK